MTDKDKVDKREHIIDAAEKIFGELGYEGASTRLLSSEACVNMAMINYYFGSKDGLLKAVIERRMAIMSKVFEDILQQDLSPWEKLKEAIRAYVARVATNKYFHKIVHREISVTRGSSDAADFLLDNMMTNIELVKQIIKEGIEKGEFKPVDIEMTVTSIFGTVYYIINSRRLASRMFNMDLLNDEVLQLELKPRLEQYFRDFLQAHLLKNEIEK